MSTAAAVTAVDGEDVARNDSFHASRINNKRGILTDRGLFNRRRMQGRWWRHTSEDPSLAQGGDMSLSELGGSSQETRGADASSSAPRRAEPSSSTPRWKRFGSLDADGIDTSLKSSRALERMKKSMRRVRRTAPNVQTAAAWTFQGITGVLDLAVTNKLAKSGPFAASRLTLHPHSSKALFAWDWCIVVCLLEIALVTPFEVAFLSPRPVRRAEP